MFEAQKNVIENKSTDESHPVPTWVKDFENFSKTFFELGEGDNANVFSKSQGPFSDYCVKVEKELPLMRVNRPDIEFSLQHELYDLGIRVPAPIAFFGKKEAKYNIILMERIQGDSVRDICNGKAQFPETFNPLAFQKELQLQIKKMHEASYYHRDLHPGNVMINNEGLPVIIDFGTAAFDPTGDTNEVYKQQAQILDRNRKTYTFASGRFVDDELGIRECMQMITACYNQQH